MQEDHVSPAPVALATRAPGGLVSGVLGAHDVEVPEGLAARVQSVDAIEISLIHPGVTAGLLDLGRFLAGD